MSDENKRAAADAWLMHIMICDDVRGFFPPDRVRREVVERVGADTVLCGGGELRVGSV